MNKLSTQARSVAMLNAHAKKDLRDRLNFTWTPEQYREWAHRFCFSAPDEPLGFRRKASDT
jgi:hypothetical protein